MALPCARPEFSARYHTHDMSANRYLWWLEDGTLAETVDGAEPLLCCCHTKPSDIVVSRVNLVGIRSKFDKYLDAKGVISGTKLGPTIFGTAIFEGSPEHTNLVNASVDPNTTSGFKFIPYTSPGHPDYGKAAPTPPPPGKKPPFPPGKMPPPVIPTPLPPIVMPPPEDGYYPPPDDELMGEPFPVLPAPEPIEPPPPVEPSPVPAGGWTMLDMSIDPNGSADAAQATQNVDGHDIVTGDFSG